MSPRAKPARSKPRTAARSKDGRIVADGAWAQVYTRLQPKDVERLRKAAERDERPVMQYLRRLILDHLDTLDQKRKAGKR